jgi:hypothetical protein
MVGIELWVRGRQSLDGLALFEKACLELNKKGMNVCLLTPSKQRILPMQELQNVLSYSNKIVIYRNQVIIESHQTITGNIAVQTTKGIIHKIADILVATPSGAILYKEAQDIAKTRAEMKSKKTKHIVYTSQIESIEDAKVRLLRDFNEEELEDMGIDINDDTSSTIVTSATDAANDIKQICELYADNLITLVDKISTDRLKDTIDMETLSKNFYDSALVSNPRGAVESFAMDAVSQTEAYNQIIDAINNVKSLGSTAQSMVNAFSKMTKNVDKGIQQFSNKFEGIHVK